MKIKPDVSEVSNITELSRAVTSIDSKISATNSFDPSTNQRCNTPRSLYLYHAPHSNVYYNEHRK